MNILFWSVGFVYSGLWLLFIMAFLANLSTLDETTWIFTFIWCLLRVVFVVPLMFAFLNTGITCFSN